MDDQNLCDEYLAGWKRAQADYQNLKKEMEREKGEYVKFANERLLLDLLPVLDQFTLALKHLPAIQELPEDQRQVWEPWIAGLKAVQGGWDKLAKTIGLERILTDGPFDPMLHEAAGEELSEEKSAGEIVRAVQDGWRLHGKVLRPARVIIAKERNT